MISLFDLCLASLADLILEYNGEDLKNVAGRLEGLLLKFSFPQTLSLISTMLPRLRKIMFSQQKQRDLIPLLKVIVKTSKILCWDGGNMEFRVNNYCNEDMSYVIGTLEPRIRYELLNFLCEDDETSLTVLHYSSYEPPPTLRQLIERSSESLVSFKLNCYNFIMSECRFDNLTELYLGSIHILRYTEKLEKILKVGKK